MTATATALDLRPPATGAGSFGPVRAAIPEQCYRRSTVRGLATVARDLVLYAALVAALVATPAWWLAVPLAVLTGLVVSGLFVLAHDAAHGALFPGERLNRAAARVLMLPSFHVREAWVIGHNRLHHGFTARQGFDFVWHPLTPAQYRALSPLGRLRHRWEWSWAGSGAYYVREVWWNKMITFRPPARRARAVWRDWALVVTVAAAATLATLVAGWAQAGTATGALWMWARVVVVPFLVFTHVIGWTVYVHHVSPTIRWWPTAAWTRWRGQMESTTILRFPRPLNLVFHNIFVHVPHHVDVRIPWYNLPEAALAIEEAFPATVVDRPFRPGDYLRATHACKLYDFEAGTWLGYDGADGSGKGPPRRSAGCPSQTPEQPADGWVSEEQPADPAPRTSM